MIGVPYGMFSVLGPPRDERQPARPLSDDPRSIDSGQAADRGIKDEECPMPDAGCPMPAAERPTTMIGHQASGIGHSGPLPEGRRP
jgi:hypothetical protein